MLAFVFAAAGSGGARAQETEEEEDVDVEASAPPVAAGPAGQYQGVAPGDQARDGRKPRRGRNPMVTWLGFQPRPGGAARIFVQLDRELPHHQQIQGGAVVISLTGARVAHSNSRRFLDTRFFGTAIDRVTIESGRRRPGGTRRARRGLELVIRFKRAAEARELPASFSAGKDGFTYLMVEVPAAATAGAAAVKKK